jgi:hypothetical protein
MAKLSPREKEQGMNKRQDFISLFLFVLFVGVLIFAIFLYKTDSSPVVGYTEYSLGEVKEYIAETQYLEFIEQIGEMTDGAIIIKWRWHDYGCLDVISAGKEQDKFETEFKIVRIR